jgi:hypothetical protein
MTAVVVPIRNAFDLLSARGVQVQHVHDRVLLNLSAGHAEELAALLSVAEAIGMSPLLADDEWVHAIVGLAATGAALREPKPEHVQVPLRGKATR